MKNSRTSTESPTKAPAANHAPCWASHRGRRPRPGRRPRTAAASTAHRTCRSSTRATTDDEVMYRTTATNPSRREYRWATSAYKMTPSATVSSTERLRRFWNDSPVSRVHAAVHIRKPRCVLEPEVDVGLLAVRDELRRDRVEPLIAVERAPGRGRPDDGQLDHDNHEIARRAGQTLPQLAARLGAPRADRLSRSALPPSSSRFPRCSADRL